MARPAKGIADRVQTPLTRENYHVQSKSQLIRIQTARALAGGTLLAHYSEANLSAFARRWPNFRPYEFACRLTGEFYYHVPTFDCCQRARNATGRAITINSGHRSYLHNAAVGGAPRSAHLFIAVDISTVGYDRETLLRVLIAAGFKSFGLYGSFIHCDMRPGRLWFGSNKSKTLWSPIMDRINQERTEARLAA